MRATFMTAVVGIAALSIVGLVPSPAFSADPQEGGSQVQPPSTPRVRPFSRNGRLTPGDDAAAVKEAETNTTVEVELLVGDQGVGLKAQEWQQVFQKIGCSLRVRSGLPTDKIEIRERKVSRIREVTVIGTLERNGGLVFKGRKFGTDQVRELEEWIQELKTYGAQGSPEGKPLWGLTKEQFQELYEKLSTVETERTAGISLKQAITKLAPRDAYPVNERAAARERLTSSAVERPVSQDLKGFSRGTALAAILAEYGLGFRPQRTPEGKLEIAIESLDKTTDCWPVGWDLPTEVKPGDLAPTLFQLVSVEFPERSLSEALKSVSEQTNVPIILDDWRIANKGIKLDEIRVKHSLKQTSFNLVIKRITTPNRLLPKIRIDEAGRPFVWIAPLEPVRISR